MEQDNDAPMGSARFSCVMPDEDVSKGVISDDGTRLEYFTLNPDGTISPVFSRPVRTAPGGVIEGEIERREHPSGSVRHG